ncbi:MAG: helix-turn-helix domain-containing protein [Lachnospiraceae bacterium]|nr:helix-turn-helix domain-containing protein [Lachnospiraceae bacterium]
MKDINIARIIISKRKEKGITQDELAYFIGVSKSSVSKWETGHSYPDINLLPQLAAYFNISLDELMGYEPQMTGEDINILYKKLANEFAARPFDEVMNHCREIINKYYSCFPLLLQIGLLFINYSPAANDEQKVNIINEAKTLFVRIKTHSDNTELKHFALHAEALCELMLGNPNQVIVLLENEKINLNFFHPSIGVMLSQSHQMLGNIKEAKITLQSSILDNIIGFFNNIPSYLAICSDDYGHFDEICRRTIEMIEVFNIKTINPSAVLPIYLAAAGGYLLMDEKASAEKALQMLEEYTNIVTGDIYPFRAKSDDFFTFIDNVKNEISFGSIDVPRDEKTIKHDLVNAVIINPAFAVFSDEPRFQNITRKLMKLIGGTQND